MTGYIYVLHFDDPYHHAQHYLGSTRCLNARLLAHACGYGSTLTRTLYAKGLNWRIGALLECQLIPLRHIELTAKHLHNTARLCLLCNDTPKRIRGARHVEPSLLGLHSDSRAIRCANSSPIVPAALPASIIIRPMKAADFTSSVPSLSGLLRNLHRANSSELGFIPMGKDTLTGLFSHHEDHPVILALTRDDQLAGYAYWWNNIAEDYQTIIQLVVADPFRLMGLGRRLVEAVEIMGNCRQTRCRVRRDLPANNFWLRMGFTNRAIITHDTSSNLLNSFQRVSHIQEFACNTK